MTEDLEFLRPCARAELPHTPECIEDFQVHLVDGLTAARGDEVFEEPQPRRRFRLVPSEAS
jgi:hypothetical protein